MLSKSVILTQLCRPPSALISEHLTAGRTQENNLHNETPPPPPPALLLLSFKRSLGRHKREERRDISETVDKRMSVSLAHLPKGLIREFNGVLSA